MANKTSGQKKQSDSSSSSKAGSNGHSQQASSSSGKENQGGFLRSLFMQGEEKQTLKDVFIELLKDMYDAEQQLVEGLPKMADAVYDEELRDAFRDHVEQTERQVTRLEKIFSRLNIDKSDVEKCEAMKGLIEEGNEVISNFKEGAVRDSALIISAQKIEHYEIATYGSLRTLAEVMKLYEIADLLERTQQEEEMADEMLSDIARVINKDAVYYYNLRKKDEKNSKEKLYDAVR